MRDGIYGCLYLAGHHKRAVIYKLGKHEPPEIIRIPKYHAPKTKRRNNLKPKRRRILLTEIAARDGGWFCAYCKKPLTPIVDVNIPVGFHDPNKPTIDHVIPWSGGGTNELDNLVMSCSVCNNEKGAT